MAQEESVQVAAQEGEAVYDENGNLVSGPLHRDLPFIYVFALATGAIFTFMGYWDTVFVSYCGPATWLAFASMTILVLPIAFTYAELAPMFPLAGGELCYNTVGMNKSAGFFSSWAILLAWIAVPPAATMAISQWVLTRVLPQFGGPMITVDDNFWLYIGISIVIVLIILVLSLNDIQVAGSVQLVALVIAIIFCFVMAFSFFFSGHWSIHNMIDTGFFRSTTIGGDGFGGWVIGLALVITPYFGFECVPQLIEEANFPMKKATKAVWGSVVTCGVVYTVFFLGICGVDMWENIMFVDPTTGGAFGDPAVTTPLYYDNADGIGETDFINISYCYMLGGGMGVWSGWTIWGLVAGIGLILGAIGTCIIGFWVSTVRLFYAMGRSHYLPDSFAKTNKHGQPIVPNLMLAGISIVFLLMQQTDFMKNFFNLMAFGCGVAYFMTCISSVRIHRMHPDWTDKTGFKMKGSAAWRYIGMVVACLVMIGTAIGQSASSWGYFAVYIGIGVILWITSMVRWKKGTKVYWITPDGEMEF